MMSLHLVRRELDRVTSVGRMVGWAYGFRTASSLSDQRWTMPAGGK